MDSRERLVQALTGPYGPWPDNPRPAPRFAALQPGEWTDIPPPEQTQGYRYADQPVSAAVQGIFGLDPSIERGSILPFGRQQGEKTWSQAAAPQWLYEMAKALVTPAHGYRGGMTTQEDALNFAFNMAGGGGAVGTAMAPRGALATGGVRSARSLPTDEASRMARAREMGFDTDAYHYTTADIDQFSPGFRHASFFSDTPQGARKGGMAGGLDNPELPPSAFESNAGANILPVKLRSKDIQGLRLSEAEETFWRSLPETVTDDEFHNVILPLVREKFPRLEKKLYSQNVNKKGELFDIDRDSIDDLRLQRGDVPSLTYEEAARTGRNVYGDAVPGYVSAADERYAAQRARDAGYAGFLQGDEAGISVAIADPRRIRSRFAKFDPAKSDSADLLAANASPYLSLIYALMGDSDAPAPSQ